MSLLVLCEHRSLLISIHTVSNPGLHSFTPQQEYHVLEILKEHQGWVHPSSTHRMLMLDWNTEEECTNEIFLLKTLAESFFSKQGGNISGAKSCTVINILSLCVLN